MGKSNSKGTNQKSLHFTCPINEVQPLGQHDSVVTHILKLDEDRMATGTEGGVVAIWNYFSGKLLAIARSHKGPITCMIFLEGHYLVTGSSDCTLKMWDLQKYKCKKTCRSHLGSIRCLCLLRDTQSVNHSMFCSGGKDRLLCVWDRKGTLVSKADIQDEGDLCCMLALPNGRVVTASNSCFLCVYSSKDGAFGYDQTLHHHQQAVTSLVNISDRLFASGSVDGSIELWASEGLTPIMALRKPYVLPATSRMSFKGPSARLYSINYLSTLNECFLIAAIGSGFAVYDIANEGKCLIENMSAHDADVISAEVAVEGRFILTASSEGFVRVWLAPPAMVRSSMRRKRLQLLQQCGHAQTITGERDLRPRSLPASTSPNQRFGLARALSRMVVSKDRSNGTSLGVVPAAGTVTCVGPMDRAQRQIKAKRPGGYGSEAAESLSGFTAANSALMTEQRMFKDYERMYQKASATVAPQHHSSVSPGVLIDELLGHEGSLERLCVIDSCGVIATAGSDNFLLLWKVGKRESIRRARDAAEEMSRHSFVDKIPRKPKAYVVSYKQASSRKSRREQRGRKTAGTKQRKDSAYKEGSAKREGLTLREHRRAETKKGSKENQKEEKEQEKMESQRVTQAVVSTRDKGKEPLIEGEDRNHQTWYNIATVDPSASSPPLSSSSSCSPTATGTERKEEEEEKEKERETEAQKWHSTPGHSAAEHYRQESPLRALVAKEALSLRTTASADCCETLYSLLRASSARKDKAERAEKVHLDALLWGSSSPLPSLTGVESQGRPGASTDGNLSPDSLHYSSLTSATPQGESPFSPGGADGEGKTAKVAWRSRRRVATAGARPPLPNASPLVEASGATAKVSKRRSRSEEKSYAETSRLLGSAARWSKAGSKVENVVAEYPYHHYYTKRVRQPRLELHGLGERRPSAGTVAAAAANSAATSSPRTNRFAGVCIKGRPVADPVTRGPPSPAVSLKRNHWDRGDNPPSSVIMCEGAFDVQTPVRRNAAVEASSPELVSSTKTDATSQHQLLFAPLTPEEQEMGLDATEAAVLRLGLPEYIFVHAEMLRKEKKYSLSQIAYTLKKAGHAEHIVQAYLLVVMEGGLDQLHADAT